MTHGSLFSGIGGFDLAARWMGWDNVFCCDVDPFCQRVLSHHFPESKLYTDVKTFDPAQSPRCDILSGGFPCQPFSHAGERRGADDPRHLWPEMCRVIDGLRPRWVVGENVAGLLNWNDGRVHEEVCHDLEALGYEVGTYVLPAVAVGSVHRRDRVWIIADSDPLRTARGPQGDEGESGGRRLRQPNAIQYALESGGVFQGIARSLSRSAPSGCRFGFDSCGSVGLCGTCEHGDNFTEATSYTDRHGLDVPRPNQCGTEGEGRDASKRSLHSESAADGHPHHARPRGWEGFPTFPPLCGGDDGLPSRLDGITFPKWRRESVKAYGNAIVPQVAFEIFKAIEMVEHVTMEQPEPPNPSS